MGGPNIGRFDSGFATARNPIQEHFVETDLMEALKTPVQAGDHAGAKKRFENVRELLSQLSPQQAGELLDQLNQKHPKDPLAKEIKYRFSNASVESLKMHLLPTSGSGSAKGLAGTVVSMPPFLGPSFGDENARKGETEVAGKLKRSALEDIWNTHSNVEKIHDALTIGSAGIDEKAISEVLSGLSKKEREQLKHAYQEKYSEDFYDVIRSRLGIDDVSKLK